MLSDSTLQVVTEEFVKQPFSIPSPGCGMDLLKHSQAVSDLANRLAETNPEAAIELAFYVRELNELAMQFAVLQLLPIEVLKTFVERSKHG